MDAACGNRAVLLQNSGSRTLICSPYTAGVVEVAIRLPHGERIMRRFQGSQPVSAVLDYARWKCPGQVGPRAAVATQLPRRVLADTRQSLREAGVANRETLTITS